MSKQTYIVDKQLILESEPFSVREVHPMDPRITLPEGVKPNGIEGNKILKNFQKKNGTFKNPRKILSKTK